MNKSDNKLTAKDFSLTEKTEVAIAALKAQGITLFFCFFMIVCGGLVGYFFTTSHVRNHTPYVYDKPRLEQKERNFEQRIQMLELKETQEK